MLLQATNITKSFGSQTILSNISMQIQERERIGLVGANGAGKSTFLQIIAGEMSYDSGNIFKAKETRIGYLAQNSGLNTSKSINEELFSVFTDLLRVEKEIRSLEKEMSNPELLADHKRYEETMIRYAAKSEWFREQGGYGIEARIRGILQGMGFGNLSADTLVHTLSGGQKTRLALAKMLLQQPDLLMLDEPTNHLDIPTLTWLEEYLRNYPGAILVVSHDRYFLDALVSIIYEIERNEARRYHGNYSRFIEIKASNYENQLKQFEKQQGEIARMEDFVRRNLVRASTTKRAQSRRKTLERMERIDKPLGDLKRAAFSFEIERKTGKDVLTINDLAFAYSDRDRLFQHVSFQLSRGDSVALIGSNGAGKSTIFKLLIDQLQPAEGSITWGSNVRIGYYDQEQSNLNPAAAILDEVWNTFPHLEEVRIRSVLGNFLFSGEDVLKKISSLSGGEKARVALAKLMLQNANVLILDEPTNHLDLYSKEVLEASLLEYEGTLLFISHDRYFLNKMAERILELNTQKMDSYLGNYDDYVEKKLDLAAMKLEQDNKAAAARGNATAMKANASDNTTSTNTNANEITSSYEAEKLNKSTQRTRQRKQDQLEHDIAKLETEIGDLEVDLTKPEYYNDYIIVQEKTVLIDRLKLVLHQYYEEWEALLVE